jgi:hypothetical protein
MPRRASPPFGEKSMRSCKIRTTDPPTRDAYEFADQLRRRRNDASHTAPTYGFEDREEVEELIISAGRHLPDLWRLH